MNLRRSAAVLAASAVLTAAIITGTSPAGALSPSNGSKPTTGALLATLRDPAATASDRFGFSVAVSGITAVIGAATSANGGAVYIYTRGKKGWPTAPAVTLHDPLGVSGDNFGESVAVSGSTVIVGAFTTSQNMGAAYIYVQGKSGWPTTPTATLADPGATSQDFFGFSVALSGSTAIVGTYSIGQAYIYTEGSSGWPISPAVTLVDPRLGAGQFDQFGYSVGVSGTTAIVGAPGSSSAGNAYVYSQGGSGWPTSPTVTLSSSPALNGAQFGSSVAVSGTTAIVGALQVNSGGNAAYIYTESRSGWPTSQTVSLTDPAGGQLDTVAISGSAAIVGAYAVNSFAGAAYLHLNGTGGWPASATATVTDPLSTANDTLGFSVAASDSTAIVGAPGTNSFSGATYLYQV